MNRTLSVFWNLGMLITLLGCLIGIFNVLGIIALPDYIFTISLIVGLLFLCVGKHLTEHGNLDVDTDSENKAQKRRAKFKVIK